MASQKIAALQISSTVLAILDGSMDAQTEIEVTGQAASVLQGTASITRHRPMVRATIEDVNAAINFFGLSGYSVENDVEVWTVKRDQGGGLKTTGNKIAFTDGLVVPESLSAQQGQNASIEYSVHGGGATSAAKPYAISLDGSVPSVTSSAQDTWRLAEGTLGGVDIGPLQNCQINFGPQVNQEEGDDALYPYAVSIDQWQIDGTVETEDPDVLDSVDEGDTGNLVIQISKRNSGGIAASGHLSISFDSQLVTLDQLSGDSRSSATTTIRVTGISSNYSTFPISIST